MSDERDGLLEQLAIHKANVATLTAQAARHGTDIPLSLRNGIDYANEQIKQIQAALDDLDAYTEMPPAQVEQPTANYSQQGQIARLQQDVFSLRTDMLVEFERIRGELRFIHDEQVRLRADLTTISAEKQSFVPHLTTTSFVVIGVSLLITLILLYLQLQ